VVDLQPLTLPDMNLVTADEDDYLSPSHEGQASGFTHRVRPEACLKPWESVSIGVYLWFYCSS
jgi:hypothetical protein